MKKTLFFLIFLVLISFVSAKTIFLESNPIIFINNNVSVCLANITDQHIYDLINISASYIFLVDWNNIQNKPLIVNGSDGISGTNGTNGVSISSVTVLTNGSLNVTLTNGTTFISGNLTGLQGIQGIQGIPGLNGADGSDGSDGAPGSNGANGLNGSNGANGLNGTNGINGLNGTNGINGSNGANGLNGTNGLNGNNLTMTSITNLFNGSYQWNFSDGSSYITGNLTGSQGIQGIQGIQGVYGNNGSNGLNGSNGVNGNNGTNASVVSGSYFINITNGYVGFNQTYADTIYVLQTTLTNYYDKSQINTLQLDQNNSLQIETNNRIGNDSILSGQILSINNLSYAQINAQNNNGTVFSVATDSTLSGGPITTVGTLSVNYTTLDVRYARNGTSTNFTAINISNNMTVGVTIGQMLFGNGGGISWNSTDVCMLSPANSTSARNIQCVTKPSG